MQILAALVFTQLSIPEVRKLFREELEAFFTENPIGAKQAETGEVCEKSKVKSRKKRENKRGEVMK